MAAGVLLTGGTSTRLDADKASAVVEGMPIAARAARALTAVADPVVAVGPEAGTGLPVVDDPRRGPLAAFVAGANEIGSRGYVGPFLLLAGDMPFVTAELLGLIADSLLDTEAVIAVREGNPHPITACYSAHAVAIARALVADGKLAMSALLAELDVLWLRQDHWEPIAGPDALLHVDSTAELELARSLASRFQDPRD